jgi:hypothetical protein
MGDNLALHFHGVLRCTNLYAVISMVTALAMAGCVSSSDRILDERDALADSYFTGRFVYQFVDKTREMRIFQNGKKYLIEENGKLVSLATLHPFRDDFLIVQTWNLKRGGGDPPYMYYLLRKTSDGFEVGKELCSGSDRSCAADTRTELFRKLDLQTKLFLAAQEKRVYFRSR